MLNINELYITPDNQKMIIDVSVKDDKWHKNAQITEIVIDTQDTVTPDTGMPSGEWIIKRNVVQGDVVSKIAWEAGKVDEYADLVCAANDCACFEYGERCGCHGPIPPPQPKVHEHSNCACGHHHHHHHHFHHNMCTCRTGETGKYCNPITMISYDLDKKTALVKKTSYCVPPPPPPICEPCGNKPLPPEPPQPQIPLENPNEENITVPLIKGLYYRQTTSSTNEETGENEESTTIYKFNGEEFVEFEYKPSKLQHIRVEINQSDMCQPFEDTMFFVWIKETGVDPNAPCSENKEYTLGICINEFTIYRRFICLMHELLKDCDVPKYFIDLYLRWQAVKMAIATGNYSNAILLWKRFFLFKHQRPLWEHPQYIRFWQDWHKDGLLPDSNYGHPVYGWGGSFFNQRGNYCRTCRK